MTQAKSTDANWYRRLARAIGRRFIAAARHPYAFLPFLLLAATDSVFPVLPAEVMAIALMVLQPHRTQLIGAGFALAAAVSALILALLVVEARDFVFRANPGLMDALERSSAIIAEWGAPALALLSIFPDSPRASIAAAAVAGVSPPIIFLAVLVGKVALYAGLGHILRRLPQLTAGLRGTRSALGRRLRPGLQRLAAFQRLVRKNPR